MTFGQKIKFYREKQKISQEHLAELSHISVSTIRKYESDERKPKEEQVEKIAHALHISPAALKDYSYDNIEEVFPEIFAIGKYCGIQFVGEKDENGLYKSESFAIKFGNNDLMDFLMDWSTKEEEIDSLKEAITVVKDKDTQQMMGDRLSELSEEIENKLVLERISNQIYFEEGLPQKPLSKDFTKEMPKFESYYQFLEVLYRLAMIIKFECVGVFERVWEKKAIFTFESESVNPDNMSIYAEECFDKFLYYYSECKRIGIHTEGYAFMQGGKKYYRYIIKDGILATSLNIINEVLQFSWDTASEFEINRFKTEIERKIKEFDMPVEL